ncbi:MAG TPA: LysR family transcriptional regulator [Alphaproteobacteria bacterium]|nr:LysR family transcriptional regulator [Alphaproteobacteria bacterium]
MTLEQLRIFVAVAEREHVTRAAEALNLTQSAVSAAVSALEARHATTLFDRIGRRIALTEAGRLFLVEARAVLARAAAAEAMLADLAGLKRGNLALAASQTVANYWLPPLLHRFRAAYPGVTLSLVIGNTEDVTAMIRDGSVDLGFVEGTVEDAALTIEPVAEDELVVVASRTVAKGGKSKRFTPDDLKTLGWVFRERGSGTRAIFEAALQDLGLAPDDLDIVLELPSNESVRAAVADGAGAAALSKLVVAPLLASGRLVAFDFELPKRRFFALRHKDRHVSEIERAFRALIETPGQ